MVQTRSEVDVGKTQRLTRFIERLVWKIPEFNKSHGQRHLASGQCGRSAAVVTCTVLTSTGHLLQLVQWPDALPAPLVSVLLVRWCYMCQKESSKERF